ncbi:MAG: PEP-CTERM sorting domain-containing protein [Gammaproteobacteria bacterium]|nr:PEP-CTERM sorting domain-containing protein [Gammaproteobacteria bacterium]
MYSPVPAPGTVWGLGSALAVLLARRRRTATRVERAD